MDAVALNEQVAAVIMVAPNLHMFFTTAAKAAVVSAPIILPGPESLSPNFHLQT